MKAEPLQPVCFPRQGEHGMEEYNDKMAKANDAINQDLQILYGFLMKLAAQQGGI